MLRSHTRSRRFPFGQAGYVPLQHPTGPTHTPTLTTLIPAPIAPIAKPRLLSLPDHPPPSPVHSYPIMSFSPPSQGLLTSAFVSELVPAQAAKWPSYLELLRRLSVKIALDNSDARPVLSTSQRLRPQITQVTFAPDLTVQKL